VALTLKTDPVPISEDATGALRVAGTRVLLELVVNAFEDGATPETIVQQYATLSLPDVYAVIAYYLRHRQEIQAYLDRREQQAYGVKQRISTAQRDLDEIRRRLLTQRAPERSRDASAGE
jgi:uncharacterized protein (DUF433 family)